MRNGDTAPTGEAMSESDPRLTLLQTFEAECVLFNAYDDRPDTI